MAELASEHEVHANNASGSAAAVALSPRLSLTFSALPLPLILPIVAPQTSHTLVLLFPAIVAVAQNARRVSKRLRSAAAEAQGG